MNHRIKLTIDGKEFDTFEDILPENGRRLKMLIIGKVPAPDSVKTGHYFQGRHGKAMWNKLTEYGILNKVTPYHDDSLLINNIGITDIVKVPREFGSQPLYTEYQQGKERINDIIKRFQPKVLFFVYKPVLENCVPIFSKIEYGFNDNLSEHFNGSKVFLFPMPGTGKVAKDLIKASMESLAKFLKSEA